MWDRYYAYTARSRPRHTELLLANNDAREIYIIQEPEAHLQIWTKAQNHEISDACPCDECIDSVIMKIRNRYVKALGKIDSGEKLDKEDSAQ